MALEDLNLEFEDEDELKKKGNGAVAVGVDLEFGSPEVGKIQPKPGQVKSIGEVRQIVTPRSEKTSVSNGAAALKLEPDVDYQALEIHNLQEKIRKLEFDASVKVAVAEFKTEILSEVMSDMKVLELQVSQLLGRIHTKHADIKPEALMIKKLLADFTAKKRK